MTLPIYEPLPAAIHHELDALPLDELVSLLYWLGWALNGHWWDMLEDCEWEYQTPLEFTPIPGGELWPSGTVVRYCNNGLYK